MWTNLLSQRINMYNRKEWTIKLAVKISSYTDDDEEEEVKKESEETDEELTLYIEAPSKESAISLLERRLSNIVEKDLGAAIYECMRP